MSAERNPYRFLPVFKVRMNKVYDRLNDLLLDIMELKKIAPENEVEPGGVVTDYIDEATGCLEGAKALLERGAEARDQIEAKGTPAGVAP
jgi:hypothetical protein